MRISDWSSDVCSSDLDDRHHLWLLRRGAGHGEEAPPQEEAALQAQGRPEAGRARLGQLSRSSASSLSWRSEKRRVGEGCVRTGRSRWSPCPLKKKTQLTYGDTHTGQN